MKRTPLPRKSPRKRTTKSPRCSNRQCKQIARVGDLCRSHAQREADRLFSLYIRQRDGACVVRTGMTLCSGGLQCAHVISRRYHSVRWDGDNALALCQAHHVYFTHRPLEWEDWVETNGIDYAALRHRALSYATPDLGDVLEHLRREVAA